MKILFRWFLGSSLLALGAACGSEDTGDAGDASAVGGDTAVTDTGSGSGSGDTTDSADTGASANDTTDSSDTTPIADTAVDGSGDSDGSGSGDGSCRTTDDCLGALVCIEGECRRPCGSDVECDDLNICTRETCEDNVCVYTDTAPEIADVTPGDCKKAACENGELRRDAPNPLDLPPDDGVGCTEAVCAMQFPFQRPRNELCDDGDELNGAESCNPNSGCVSGDSPVWIRPSDNYDPLWESVEACGDGQDNNGNGLADEGCPCEFGTVQRCYLGPPATRNVGACLDGLQQCTERLLPHWGPCENDFPPTNFVVGQPDSVHEGSGETCDNKDNDCDGCIDDLADCTAIVDCPVEDVARPLADYQLNGPAIYPNTEQAESWRWTVRGPPNSATAGPVDPNAPITSVYFDVSGDYYVSLVVHDAKGDQGCSWVVHVQGTGLRVEMRWDTFGSVDMDLHLHRSGTTTAWCNNVDDCHFANCRTYGAGLPWGYTASPAEACGGGAGDTCWNPRLDIDNIRGTDPENINVDNPNNGDRFRVMAHMYSGSARTNPVITIYCGGRIKSVLGESPDLAGLTSSGGGCQGETWRVADVIMSVDSRGLTDCIVDVLTNDGGGWDIRRNDTSF